MLIMGEKQRENHSIAKALKCLWKIAITFVVLGIMLSPGLILDCVYKNRDSCGFCGNMIDFFKRMRFVLLRVMPVY